MSIDIEQLFLTLLFIDHCASSCNSFIEGSYLEATLIIIRLLKCIIFYFRGTVLSFCKTGGV